MPCSPITLDGKVVGLACSRGSQRCSVGKCGSTSRFLCDGIVQSGEGTRVCSRPLCGGHKYRTAAGDDLCPTCFGAYSAARVPPG